MGNSQPQNSMGSAGRVIMFEGADEAGKTTLSTWLVERLGQSGYASEYISFPERTPGSLGSLIYDLHHDHNALKVEGIDPVSLQIMHAAAHVDVVRRRIIPMLRLGKIIVSDRYWWSLHTYGKANNVDPKVLDALTEIIEHEWGGIVPDIGFLLLREGLSSKGCGHLKLQDINSFYLALSRLESQKFPVETVLNNRGLNELKAYIWNKVLRVI